MKQKNLLIIVVLAVVLGGIWLLMRNTEDGPQKQAGAGLGIGDRLLPDLPVNEVAKMTITEDDETVTLERRDGEWVVGERAGYPADFEALSQFLKKAWGLKVTQKATVARDNFAELNLDPAVEGDDAPPKPVIIAFADADGNELARLLVGKEHFSGSTGGADDRRSPNGRFVAVGENPENAFVISDTLRRATADPLTWLNDEFLKVKDIVNVQVDRPGEEDATDWSVSRDDPAGDFQLADLPDGEEADTSKLNRLKNLFANLNYDDVKLLSEVNQDELFAEATTATIETADGITYTVRIGEETEDANYPFHVDIEADLEKAKAEEESEEPEAAEAAEDGEGENESENVADETQDEDEAETKLRELKELLAQQERFENWLYYVPQFAVSAVLQDKGELIAQPEEEEEGQNAAAPGAPGGMPGQVTIPGADGSMEITAPAGQPIQIPVNVNTGAPAAQPPTPPTPAAAPQEEAEESEAETASEAEVEEPAETAADEAAPAEAEEETTEN